MSEPHRIGPTAGLHRIDWRFLLPIPANVRLARLWVPGATPDQAAELVAAGLANEVATAFSAGVKFDGVIVHLRSMAQLREHASCLSEHGVLYCEVRRSRQTVLLTPRRLRERLRALGLTVAATYLLRPSVGPGQAYLPLGSGRAVEWFLDHKANTRTGAQCIAVRVARFVARRAHRLLEALARRYAVVAVAGSDRATHPWIFNHPSLPSELRERGDALLLAPSADDHRRVTVLAFPAGHPTPTIALKVPRRADGNADTEREQATLTHLRAALDDNLRQALPTPLGLHRSGGLASAAEAVLPGKPLSTLFTGCRTRRAEQVELFERAAGWLTEFQRAAPADSTRLTAGELDDWIGEPLRRYEVLFEVGDAERALLRRIGRLCAALNGPMLPLVREHWDFYPNNITWDGRHIGVIDWEASAVSLPMFDLLYLAARTNDLLQDATGASARRAALGRLMSRPIGEDPFSEAVYRIIGRYVDALRIDQRWVPILATLAWVVRAIERAGEYQHPDGAAADPEANEYVGFVTQLAADLHGGDFAADSLLGLWYA
jgi:hypothetical protein